MTRNLIAELVKKGIPPGNIAKEIAKTLEVSEKTARNKLNGVTAFTFPEAVKINDDWFGGTLNLEYLFKQSDRLSA
ncbi:MAG: hypothetical protein J1E06_05895 [Acutalibacter sp.]|nr:hypothetical protein [Acutalibacter sp.]